MSRDRLEKYYRIFRKDSQRTLKTRQTPKILKRIFPKEKAEKLYAAYLTLRFIDDIADNPEIDAVERKAFLEDIKSCYERCCEFEPVLKLKNLARDQKLQKRKFFEMLDAMEVEIDKEGGFFTDEELYSVYLGVQVAPQWIMFDIAELYVPEEFHKPVGIAALKLKQIRGKEILEDFFWLNRVYFSVEELDTAAIKPHQFVERLKTANFDLKTQKLFKNRIKSAYDTLAEIDPSGLEKVPKKILEFGAVYVFLLGYWVKKLKSYGYRPYNIKFIPIKDSPPKVYYLGWLLKAKWYVKKGAYERLYEKALENLKKGF